MRCSGTASGGGAGYGRVTMVLAEFARTPIGVEREARLVDRARSLLPQIRFIRQDSLLRLPFGDDAAGFSMAFTVLQHMVDEDCMIVLSEIKRSCRPGGSVLLAERYKPGDETARATDLFEFLSKCRPLDVWKGWMEPFGLVEAMDRPMQPLWKGARSGG